MPEESRPFRKEQERGDCLFNLKIIWTKKQHITKEIKDPDHGQKARVEEGLVADPVQDPRAVRTGDRAEEGRADPEGLMADETRENEVAVNMHLNSDKRLLT